MPDRGTSALTSSARISLIRQSLPGAESYMFNPAAVKAGTYCGHHVAVRLSTIQPSNPSCFRAVSCYALRRYGIRGPDPTP